MSNLYLYLLPILLYTYYIVSNIMSAFSIEDTNITEDPNIRKIEPGRFLYHGNLEKENDIHDYKGIKWFSEDIHNVLQYGYPKKYTVREPLRLIRIDNIPKNYFDKDGIQNNDFRDIYNIFFNTLKNGDKCRNSVRENDEEMAQFLIKNGYDGYIMNKMLNCTSFDGGMFHSELAFKVMNRLDNGVDAINEIPKNNGEPYEFYFDGEPYTGDEDGMDRFVKHRKQKKEEALINPQKKKRKTKLLYPGNNDNDDTKLSPMGSLFGNDDTKPQALRFHDNDSDDDVKNGGSNVKRTKKRRKKAKKQNKKTKRKKNKSKRKRIKK